MSYLFTVENNVVRPNTETILIEPFKSIWERDNTIKKERALKEFAYIEFMKSFLKSNPYKGYELNRRDQILKRDVIKNSSWVPDDLILEAMDKLEEFQKEASPNYTLYKNAVQAKDKLENFLNGFDINERTASNALILKPKDITTALLDIDKVATSLNSLEKKIEEDLYEISRTRSNKEVSIFAKPENLR